MHKETAKWLMALVPTGALAASAIAVAPYFSQARRQGWSAWWGDNSAATMWLAVVLAAVIAAVAAAAYVLLAAPDPLSKLENEPALMSVAFSEGGVGAPTFNSSDQYTQVNARIAADLAVPDFDLKSLEATIGAVERTGTQLRAWSEERNARMRFRKFSFVYVIGVGVIAVGVVAIAVLSRPSRRRSTNRPRST